jgi:IS30 family transposase
MKNYAHLTQAERYQIAILCKAGHSMSEIARLMNRHRSTIGREIARNRGQRGYRPKQAQAFSRARMRARENGRRIPDETWIFVDARLGELWSPEQISGRLKADCLPSVSHEAIYQRIYADKDRGGTLHRALRCQKARRKRYGSHERRGAIPNQVSIEQRPALVDRRERFGDWEADLVIGAGQQQALVTLNERKSRYALIAHVPFKTAKNVSEAMISLLTPFATHVHTLTTDNGREFAQHEQVAKQLSADYFFAHPYSSWERGANENMNGLIRQFFPKKMRFESISFADIKFAMHRLNHRPRKCLGFKTPHEVFTIQLHSCHSPVALQT